MTLAKRYLLIGDLIDDVTRTAGPGGDRPDQTLSRGRPVLVPGRSAGGPERLVGPVVDAFIDCERSGSATVLLAAAAEDLSVPVAAVCRYVVADRPEVVEEAEGLFGADRVVAAESASVAAAGAWIDQLPTASDRPIPFRERFVSVAKNAVRLKDVYGRIRGR